MDHDTREMQRRKKRALALRNFPVIPARNYASLSLADSTSKGARKDLSVTWTEVTWERSMDCRTGIENEMACITAFALSFNPRPLWSSSSGLLEWKSGFMLEEMFARRIPTRITTLTASQMNFGFSGVTRRKQPSSLRYHPFRCYEPPLTFCQTPLS